MTSYYTCSRCHRKWSVRLDQTQVCPDCQTELCWEQAQRVGLVVGNPVSSPPPEPVYWQTRLFESWTMPVVIAACNMMALFFIVFDFLGKTQDILWYIREQHETYMFVTIIFGISAFMLSGLGLRVCWQPDEPRQRTLQTLYGMNLLAAGVVIVMGSVYLLLVPDNSVDWSNSPIEQAALPGQNVRVATTLFDHPMEDIQLESGIRQDGFSLRPT